MDKTESPAPAELWRRDRHKVICTECKRSLLFRAGSGIFHPVEQAQAIDFGRLFQVF
jgi:hypothetical protein